MHPPENKWSYPPSTILARVNQAYPGAYQRLWDAVNAASQFPGAELTGWYRDPARNRMTAGAARYSQHLLGLALDLYAPNLEELAAHLRRMVPGVRVVVERPTPGRPIRPHVHVQAVPAIPPAARGIFSVLYPQQYPAR